MQLRMGRIGVTGGMGAATEGVHGAVIGMPLWVWVANPAPNTTGPITASDSDRGISVSATATLDRIEWTLSAPGTARLTCSGANAAGTPYHEGYGGSPSPTCGWQFQQINQAGTFTLTGTAYWVVEWSGGGQSGTLVMDPLSESMAIEIFEIQVLRIA